MGVLSDMIYMHHYRKHKRTVWNIRNRIQDLIHLSTQRIGTQALKQHLEIISSMGTNIRQIHSSEHISRDIRHRHGMYTILQRIFRFSEQFPEVIFESLRAILGKYIFSLLKKGLTTQPRKVTNRSVRHIRHVRHIRYIRHFRHILRTDHKGTVRHTHPLTYTAYHIICPDFYVHILCR